MMRMVIAAIVGYAVWTVLWLGGNAGVAAGYPEELAAYTDGGSLTATAPLAISICLSILCSVVAGFVAATIAKGGAQRAVLAVAVLLMLTGLGVQGSAWSRMPVWYHLVFLALLVPMTVLGGRLKRT